MLKVADQSQLTDPANRFNFEHSSMKIYSRRLPVQFSVSLVGRPVLDNSLFHT